MSNEYIRPHSKIDIPKGYKPYFTKEFTKYGYNHMIKFRPGFLNVKIGPNAFYPLKRKTLFDQISRFFSKGIKWDNLRSDVPKVWEKSRIGTSQTFTKLSHFIGRWSANHPRVVRLGIGAGLGMLIYGIGIRLAGGATLPRMREGYGEMTPSDRYSSQSHRNLKAELSDFGSKADISDTNTSSVINYTMMAPDDPNSGPSNIARDTLARIKSTNVESQHENIDYAPITRDRSLPRHPRSQVNQEVIEKKLRALSLAVDARPHMNPVFRAHQYASKGHRVRNTDHARAMNMSLNGV